MSEWWAVVGYVALFGVVVPLLLYQCTKSIAMGWRRGCDLAEKKEREERFPNRRRNQNGDEG